MVDGLVDWPSFDQVKRAAGRLLREPVGPMELELSACTLHIAVVAPASAEAGTIAVADMER